MQVTIAGSYRKHFAAIIEHKHAFESLGAQVLRPASEEIISDSSSEVVRLAGDPPEASAVAAAQRRAITESDVLYVVNPGGYVGPSAVAEMGYAYALGLLVVCAEPPYERAAAELTAHVGAVAETIDFLPKEALPLPVLLRRLFGALARHNLGPWILGQSQWHWQKQEKGYRIVNEQEHPLISFTKAEGWVIYDEEAQQIEAQALRALLLQHGQSLTIADS